MINYKTIALSGVCVISLSLVSATYGARDSGSTCKDVFAAFDKVMDPISDKLDKMDSGDRKVKAVRSAIDQVSNLIGRSTGNCEDAKKRIEAAVGKVKTRFSRVSKKAVAPTEPAETGQEVLVYPEACVNAAPGKPLAGMKVVTGGIVAYGPTRKWVYQIAEPVSGTVTQYMIADDAGQIESEEDAGVKSRTPPGYAVEAHYDPKGWTSPSGNVLPLVRCLSLASQPKKS